MDLAQKCPGGIPNDALRESIVHSPNEEVGSNPVFSRKYT